MIRDHARVRARRGCSLRSTSSSTVIGRNIQRHRHQEFIRALNTVEAKVPAGKEIHAIIDNYATHQHPKVRQWLARHPRWIFNVTPTSAYWPNARRKGIRFAKLARRLPRRRGVLHPPPICKPPISTALSSRPIMTSQIHYLDRRSAPTRPPPSKARPPEVFDSLPLGGRWAFIVTA